MSELSTIVNADVVAAKAALAPVETKVNAEVAVAKGWLTTDFVVHIPHWALIAGVVLLTLFLAHKA